MNKLPAAYQLATLIILFFFAWYDIRHHKVRNTALFAFLPWCLSAVPLSVLSGTGGSLPHAILSSLEGFLCGGIVLLAASLLTHGGIGGGDVKLAAVLGICYGYAGILFVLASASLSALICAGAYRWIVKGRMERIAFVPYLAAGSALMMIFKTL